MADPLLPTPLGAAAGTSIALICIGLLVLVPSGLSTIRSVGVGSYDPLQQSLIVLALACGGPPTAIGLALLVWGLRRGRK